MIKELIKAAKKLSWWCVLLFIMSSGRQLGINGQSSFVPYLNKEQLIDRRIILTGINLRFT